VHETEYDEMAREFSLRVGQRAVCGRVQGFPLAISRYAAGTGGVYVAMSPDGLAGAEGLLPRLREAYGVSDVRSGGSSASFRFLRARKPLAKIGAFLRQEMPEFAARGWNREFLCPHCRRAVRGEAEYLLIREELLVLHPDCAGPYERAARAAWEEERARTLSRESAARGFLGALLGAIVGAVLGFGAMVLMSLIPYFDDWGEVVGNAYGFLVALGAYGGHDAFRGRSDRSRTARAIAAAAIAVCGTSAAAAAWMAGRSGAPMFGREFRQHLAVLLFMGGLGAVFGFVEPFGGSRDSEAEENTATRLSI